MVTALGCRVAVVMWNTIQAPTAVDVRWFRVFQFNWSSTHFFLMFNAKNTLLQKAQTYCYLGKADIKGHTYVLRNVPKCVPASCFVSLSSDYNSHYHLSIRWYTFQFRSPFCKRSDTGWPFDCAGALRDVSYQSLHRLPASRRNTSLFIDLEGKWLRPIRYHPESGNGVLWY